MSWILTRGLTTWRGEINTTFSSRDKTSDGTIGDAAHAAGTSGHNNENSGHAEYNDHDGIDEVRAIDVDKDLRNPKFSMEQLIQWLVSLGRAGKYLPFRYFIFNGRIWRKSTGWKTEKYTGPNKHDHHAHFSGDYTEKADNWTGILGLAAYVKKVTTPAPPKPVKPVPPVLTKPPALKHYALGARTLRAGVSAGDDVAYVQKVCGGVKYFGAIDGGTGDKFTAGVKRYQGIVGLSKDGIIGPKTWAQIKKIK